MHTQKFRFGTRVRGLQLGGRQQARHRVKKVLCVAQPQTQHRVGKLQQQFQELKDPRERYELLVELGQKLLPEFPEDKRQDVNRVMGCTSQVWVSAERSNDGGGVTFTGDSDSMISRGLVAVLASVLSGLTLQEILDFQADELNELGLGPAVMGEKRHAGFRNMLESMKKRARALYGEVPMFPSLLITKDNLEPQGAFAVAQAKYLKPNQDTVKQLVNLLREKSIGVVAHFYMDPEVQGVLSSAAEEWPHIHISDSLVMADRAVSMAEAGCKYVAVLGVDFMSENVQAILQEAGHNDVKVFRMSQQEIGCTLAEAAESQSYIKYLDGASEVDRSLHVIYINTSLRTKAEAHSRVPTITCTSSNVVQTVLQGFAQIPNLTVWYGPDTYMGRNIAQLFQQLSFMSDEEIQELHAEHTQESIKSLLPRLHYFEDGTCVVHHMFGGEVCEAVRIGYGDAYLTAHFEVPGEMFTLAMEAKRSRDMGVVGSTSNILNYIASKVELALKEDFPQKLQFVLGTESGMITSIVRKVQQLLQADASEKVEVEIVFPVSQNAITTQQQQTSSSTEVSMPTGISVLPGVASGEGCSAEGGCASCPYMKMNTLDALLQICERVGDADAETSLEGFRPKDYVEQIGGMTMASAGSASILHMRDFQKSGKLSQNLVNHIVDR
eukprot:TRINITY_DN3797_c0_g1_i2.p1 TRINITY_DN3797_c0_g1~~TRINITY_DN3797_c0_g1_i2.p1  ORF type:complete len:667 (+),score=133.56 TRINITY_DN3797_c0_g1_i2:137-2137(+)